VELVLALLDRAGILVQPGFLFGLEGEPGRSAAHLVLSLLPEPEAFDEGVLALARVLGDGAPSMPPS
jgi:hypothetical protein